MKRLKLGRHAVLRSCVFSYFLAVACVVAAEDLPAAKPVPATAPIEEVIVTGSRIAQQSTLDATSPFMSVSAQDIQGRGLVNLGNVLADLPALSSLGNSGGSLRNGQGGVNLLNLRGLGAQRTLVLINGRRQVATLGDPNAVDVNTIPMDLVDKVEIITGGASAIYGADAVGGVVNFILKKRHDGITARLQGGESSRGTASSQLASITGGDTFAADRGSFVVNVEAARSAEVSARDAAINYHNGGYAQNPADTGPNDGIPNTLFFRNIAFNYTPPGGAVAAGSPFNNPALRFNSDGTLRPYNLGSQVLSGGVFGIGSDGLGLDDTVTVQPKINRVGVNLLGNLQIRDALNVYGEAKYSRSEAEAHYGAPLNLDEFNFLPLDLANPFLSSQAKDAIASAGLSGPLYLTRFSPDLGAFGTQWRRSLARVVAGAKGSFGERWSYDASYTYSRSQDRTHVLNDISRERYANATDAVADSAGILGVPGAPVCRARLADPASDDPAIAQCEPLNLFGLGAPSQAALDFIHTPTSATDTLHQQVATAALIGTLAHLPAGPLRVAAGVEYRKEQLNSQPDLLLQNGLTAANGTQPIKGAFSVRELLSEISVPLLSDMPGFRELTVDGAVRLSDSNLAGSNTTWKVGSSWVPVAGLHLRGTLSEAVRAPALVELFQSQTRITVTITDPCDVHNVDLTPDRARNCSAIGVPPGFSDPAQTRPVGLLEGGNPGLDPERARSWTAGFVIQPPSFSGLTLSMDYWSIDIRDVIASTGLGEILDGCVDGVAPNQDYCALVTRDSQAFVTQVTAIETNLARRVAKGFDFDLGYLIRFDALGELGFRLVGTRLNKFTDYAVQNDLRTANPELGQIGIAPKSKINASATWNRGRIGVTYGARYVDTFINGNPTLVKTNPEARSPRELSSRIYHDLNLSYAFTPKISSYAGVSNLTDIKPPLGTNVTTPNFGYYDLIGRAFFAGIKADF